jgi:hypothetical protein
MSSSSRGSAKCFFLLGFLLILALRAEAQIQIDFKLPRLQYIAYEPVIATIGITNLAGRDIDLRDAGEQVWFGFEITDKEGQPIASASTNTSQPPIHIEAGKRVTRKINLTPLYAVHEYGTYHVRAYIYFADLSRFFYSQRKVFEVTEARPIWQKTVGIPADISAPGNTRTYSLLTNRFPNHTAIYVRVEDKESGIVYATHSLGRIIAFDEPHAELDRENQLHVLHCSAPRTWIYTRVSLNGEVLAHSSLLEARTRPRLTHSADGAVSVRGGVPEAPVTTQQQNTPPAPKLSDRPPNPPKP